MSTKLFRKAALDRLSSPDQLDRLVTITSTRSWIAVSGLALLAAFVVSWGILGRVATNVSAKGLLVTQGGRVQSAMSPTGGVVERVTVSIGETVTKGQPVALIVQAEAEQKLAGSKDFLSERERELSARRTTLQRELSARRANLRQRREALRQSMAAASERIGYLERQVKSRQEMLSMGYATAERLHEAQTDLNRARHELADGQAQVIAVDAEEVQAQLEYDRELARLESAVADARRRVNEMSTQVGLSSSVLAPAAGRVTELKVSDGSVVAIGQPVLSIETAGAALQAVVYIPTEHGKKVSPGMPARITPSIVKKEEHGTILGTVAAVSAFPATRTGMATVLQNDSLIDAFSKKGAPYEARVDLTPGQTPTGYAWTSGGGPDLDLTSGTTVEVDIAVRTQPPIQMVLPFLRKSLGVDG